MTNILVQIRKNKWLMMGLLIGGIAGFLYWNFIGCASGTCMITSRWYNSVLLGMAWGGLLTDIVISLIPNKKKKENEQL